LVLAAGASLATQLGEVAGEVLLQPAADLGAERLVLGAVGEIHADRVTYQALVWFRRTPPSHQEPDALLTARACGHAAGVAARRRGAPRRPPGVRRGRADALLRRASG